MIRTANLTRWTLPICLLIGAILRFHLFSFIYALLFLATPWILIHSTVTRPRFFIPLAAIALVTSTVFLLAIGTLHIFSITSKGQHLFAISCSLPEIILQHIGLTVWRHTPSKVLFVLSLVVDVTIALNSLAVVILHKRRGRVHDSHHPSLLLSSRSEELREGRTSRSTLLTHFQSISLRVRPIFIYLHSLIFLALIHSCGCLVPSLPSAFYFLVALGFALWWALGKHFGRTYLYIIRLLQVYSAIHLLIIYLFQLTIMQHYFLSSTTKTVRLLGLQLLSRHACHHYEKDSHHNWIVYVHPFFILTLYWTTIYEYHLSWEYQQRTSTLFSQNAVNEVTPPSGDDGESNRAETNPKISQTNSLLIVLLSYISSKAYMLSIVSMLIWSITYHSYLTFSYLILSCIIWLLPRSKYWCHLFSPLFCIYAYILLILNYIDLLNLIEKKFPWHIHEIELFHTNERQQTHVTLTIGMECTMKFIYTLLLLLSLREKQREQGMNFHEHMKLMAPVRRNDVLPIDPSTDRWHRACAYVRNQYTSIYEEIYYLFYMGYVRVWFFDLFLNWSRLLTIILVFLLSYGSGSSPVAYRIIYMAFFLQYHLCYTINNRLWQLYLHPFYVTLIIYSMIVLFTIYVYQYEELTPVKTRICIAQIKCELLLTTLGIRRAQNNELVKELFTPTAFIILIVMHVHFFSRQRIYSPHRIDSKPSPIRILRLIEWFKPRIEKIKSILWCLCELHAYKVLLLIVCVCFTRQANVCLMNFIMVFLFVISLFIPWLQSVALVIYALVAALHILMIMILRLELFAYLGSLKNVCRPSLTSSSHGEGYLADIDPSLLTRTIAPLEWFGLWTVATSEATIGRLIFPYLCVVLGVTGLQLVRRHRHPASLSLVELFSCTRAHLFPTVDIHSMNDSFWHTVKYVCNYGSYRFGLELAMFAALYLIILRMDAVALVHAIVLLFCLLLPRQLVRRLWRFYRIFASILAIWLYLNALGLPPVLCLKDIFDRQIPVWFPWHIWSQIKIYLYLSNYFEWRPLSNYLLPDLILLIIFTVQESNFLFEQQQTSIDRMGTNENNDRTTSYRPNLLHDFITNATLSWSNRLAALFYSYAYWVIIGYLYIVATYRQSLFYLLILLACFLFLWYGQDFLRYTFRQQQPIWHLLILAFFVLFLAQLFMQPLSCILIHYVSIESRCILINLFNVPCSIERFRQFHSEDCPRKDFWTVTQEHNENEYWRVHCQENIQNTSAATILTRRAFYCQSGYNRLIFDAIGFLFVLLFGRLLNSYPFFYVRLELEVQSELSQMGALLLSQLNWLKLIEYQQRTTNELERIKARVIQIRQRRTMQKLEADVDEPIYHYPAILSGDYYMFDYSFDGSENSDLISTADCVPRSSSSQHSITLFDILDWKAHDGLNDDETSAQPPPSMSQHKEWDNKFVENPTFQHSWNASAAAQPITEEEKDQHPKTPISMDLSSIMTFLELKQNSDKIRRALDTMNSRLIIYLGHQVRTLLTISQVISDAKLYLKYPHESAQLVTMVPEQINDYIVNVYQNVTKQPSPAESNRQPGKTDVKPNTDTFTTPLDRPVSIHNTLSKEEMINVPPSSAPIGSTSTKNLSAPSSSTDRLNSRLRTWIRSSIKITLAGDGRPLSTEPHHGSTLPTPSDSLSSIRNNSSHHSSSIREHVPPPLPVTVVVDEHLKALKQSRVQIGAGTIILAFFVSKFDYLTYLTLILNFLASGAALIWLPFLGAIYFWAMLTFPYPSRRFWHVLTLSTMAIFIVQYGVSFLGYFPRTAYIRHSLVGRLNMMANLIFLGVLSFHRIVLHQLGLWEDFRLPTEDSLFYQTDLTPSNTKHIRDTIIRGIYTMLKSEIERNQTSPIVKPSAAQATNFNASTETTANEEIHATTQPVDVKEPMVHPGRFRQRITHTTNYCREILREIIRSIKSFYNFAIACPIVPKADYYSSMFLCDFLVIFLIIIGHQRFSRSDSVQDNIVYRYFQGSSSIDVTPILMLLTQFLLIIVDRIIYLKKNVNGKFAFLCFQFCVLHIWLVIIYPTWFQREMSSNWAAVSIYIFKSFYFMLSALQIRSGYPKRILGNFLTRRYSVLRLLCYKLYCIIPFLYEMRVLMDWMFIPTSLSLSYYFMMEEIARNAWTQKCWRVTDARSPQKRAQNRGRCERYCVGGWILFAIILVIWFPLLFFSVSTSLADPIPVDRCEIKVRLSTYKELYQVVTASIRAPNASEFIENIQPLISNSSFASGPRDFSAADVACIRAPGNAGAQWAISASGLKQLQDELEAYINNTNSVTTPQIYFDYSLMRKAQTSEQDVLPAGYIEILSGTHNVSLLKADAVRLLTMLESDNQTEETIIGIKLMPKFIHLLPDMIDTQAPIYLQDVRLILRREKQLLWWDISEVAVSQWQTKCSFDLQALNLITVSERAGAQSKSFNLIAKLLIGGNAKLTLIGVYAGLVYVIWLTCFRQTLFSDIQLIMYHEWAFADRVQKLCEEVYLVRELGELQLEEELFARLLFLHRSPETLIRFTRPKAMAMRQEQYRHHLHQN